MCSLLSKEFLMKYLNITFLSEATSLIDLKGENNTNPFDYLLLAR